MTRTDSIVVFGGVAFRPTLVRDSVARVANFENLFSLKLPSDYRDFLHQVNGGEMQRECYIAIPGVDAVLLHTFKGLGRNGYSVDIEVWLGENEDSIPHRSIPISSDPGGNIFLLDTSDGGIYYWDRDYTFQSSNESENTYFVCTGFSEFLARFRSTVEEAQRDVGRLNEDCPIELPQEDLLLRKELESTPKLQDRLELLGNQFVELKSESLMEVAYASFKLSTSLDNWTDRNSKFITEKVDKFIKEDVSLKDLIEAMPNLKLLYVYLWAYVLGQYAADKISDSEFLDSKRMITDTVTMLASKK